MKNFTVNYPFQMSEGKDFLISSYQIGRRKFIVTYWIDHCQLEVFTTQENYMFNNVTLDHATTRDMLAKYLAIADLYSQGWGTSIYDGVMEALPPAHFEAIAHAILA